MLKRLIPILGWLPNYDISWLSTDLLTGATVAMISVPQSMGYAKVAGVPLQHGLYSSFIGALLYQVFGTSKDVSAGPSAISLNVIGQLAASAVRQDSSIEPVGFVIALGFLIGCFEFLFGILNLGILIDLISSPVIMGFTTGVAIQTISSQFISMLGIKIANSSNPTYQIIIDACRNLDQVNFKGDAGFGLGTLVFLHLWTVTFRYLDRKGHKWSFYALNAGNAIVIVSTILISFGIAQQGPLQYRIIGTIPSGLGNIKFPKLERLDILFSTASAGFIITLLEHISVAKGFARLNGYKIDPNQEMIAMGIINIIGSMFSAVLSTGTFSRTAIKSKMGVKSPLDGLFASSIILFAICFLVSKFYFMPSSVLNAIIVYALLGLVNSPREVYELWRVKKSDVICFMVTSLLILCVGLQVGFYSGIGVSLLFMLYDYARPKINVLFKVGQEWMGMLDDPKSPYEKAITKGIGIFKFEQSLTYVNAAHQCQLALDWVEENCRQEKDVNAPRLWNEPKVVPVQSNLPPLRGIIFDLSACTEIDSTGFQNLLTLCQQFFKYAGWQIPIYFVNVRRGIKRIVHKLHKRLDRLKGEEIDLEIESKKVYQNCGCALIKHTLDEALDVFSKHSRHSIPSHNCYENRKAAISDNDYYPDEAKFYTFKSDK